jgi:hypothetical protein
MRKLARRFLDWLDERFPAKVTVTEEGYNQLLDMYKSTNQRSVMLEGISAAHQSRLEKLEDSISAIKEGISKQQNPVAVEMHRRSQFIANGRMPE